MEDAITDSQALRRFVGIDLSREVVPDETTLLQFRHLLEERGLTETVFEAVNAHLSAKGLMMREGTIADATIIPAPASANNEAKARDPEMQQTKKGNPWHFGMKAHIGVDAESGLVRIPGKLDTHSTPIWTPIPEQTGQRLQSKLDSLGVATRGWLVCTLSLLFRSSFWPDESLKRVTA